MPITPLHTVLYLVRTAHYMLCMNWHIISEKSLSAEQGKATKKRKSLRKVKDGEEDLVLTEKTKKVRIFLLEKVKTKGKMSS